jgi:4-diphosphocytidyl-2-C-methyl-D-erythritol kinase
VRAAARATGADVPVCLDPRPRVMRGIGEVLSPAFALPSLPAVLVNPGVALATGKVFAAFAPGPRPSGFDPETIGKLAAADAVIDALVRGTNDLEPAAIALCPPVADVLATLKATPGCRLARMSGSGATCFGLYAGENTATDAARALTDSHSDWWVRATVVG